MMLSFKMKESNIYWMIWIGGVLFALQRFAYSCRNHYIISPDDFETGYGFINRYRDRSDAEWTMVTSLFLRYWLLFCIQPLSCQFISRTKPEVLPIYYALYPMLCLVVILGFAATSVFVLLILMFFLVSLSGFKGPCYLLTLFALFLLHKPQFVILKTHLLQANSDSFLFDVALAYLLAKCLSFAVDNIEAQKKVHKYTDIATIVAYCLYLPTVFTGPILNYETFHNQMFSNERTHLSLKEFLLEICHVLYFMMWYFVNEILLHFVYSSAILFYPEIVSKYDSWSLCGFGYALSIMFYVKYFVIYGMSGSLANLEGFYLPPPPKCISCIHVSSYLWRHFDRGLYLWLLKYFYRPILKLNFGSIGKLYAFCTCFSFVCLWHGLEDTICLWTALNLFLMSSEIAVRFVLRTHIGKWFEEIPVVLQRTLKAAIATPHFLIMCISCSFFLSNWEIGVLLTKRILLSGLIPLVPISFIMFCGCQVSMNVRQRR